MADRKQQDQQSEEAKAASESEESNKSGGTAAVNPVDLGTKVDDLPPVPGAGQFMAAEDFTEPIAPDPEQPQSDPQQQKR
jgi:hypothetical protein